MSAAHEAVCDVCRSVVPYRGGGRPRRRHPECVAEKQRAYREANRAEIAEKQRARHGLICGVCGDPLRHPSDDGLCGFCREEIAA